KQLFFFTGSKCDELEDGFYTDGCSSNYYGCANKMTIYMTCQPGLFFDEVAQTCDYKDNVPACNTAKRYVFEAKTSSDITKSAIASINYDCLNKEDSTYSLGLCKQEFLSCKNGRAAVEKCNAGYFYNVATRLCTDLLSNPSCNPIPMRNEEFETRGLPRRPNEVVALSCSSKYYVCSNNRLSVMNCPEKTVYDAESNRCDYKTKVRGCANLINVMDKIERFENSAFCDNRDDGNYAIGKCETTFISCSVKNMPVYWVKYFFLKIIDILIRL
ncbi:unnamed protein product, partial [Enterobius vermicularis]|uniref:Chitin-binding type-2 domain-containing protein n=1 Tax=Enterobius vermicularis TaxID=51028 RepID=A0A158QB76_ENTVE